MTPKAQALKSYNFLWIKSKIRAEDGTKMGSADKKIEKRMKEGQDTVWFDEPSFPREKNTQEVQPPEGKVWHEHTKQVVGSHVHQKMLTLA